MSQLFGQLPARWKLSRVDRVATVSARIGWEALTADEYQPDGYVFLATPNIKSEQIDFENVNYISRYRYDESPELKLAAGDVLLVKDGNTLGITNLVRDLPRPATVNGSIAVLRPFGVHPAFLRYTLASSSVQGRIDAIKGGMGVPHLFQRDIRRLPIPLPPPAEQQRIADFLGAETARADALIAKKQRVSSLLTMHFKSELQYVFDGLPRSRTSLGRFVRSLTQGSSPQADDRPYGEGEYGLLKLSAVRAGCYVPTENKALSDNVDVSTFITPRSGDLLVTRSNTPDYVGAVCAVTVEDPRVVLCDLIYRVCLDGRLLSEFAALTLMTAQARAHLSSAARGTSQSMVKLRGDDIRATPVPVVPLALQQEVVQRFSQLRAKIGWGVDAHEQQIDLLRERRRALIAAAVTGRLAARGMAG